MQYTDFSVLINLALITVIYSTFISPNLKKLSDLKEKISNIVFPPKVSEDTKDDVRAAGLVLRKKFAQYREKYDETKRFLRYFYVILILILIVQIILMAITNTVTVDSVLRLVAAVIIVVILVISIRSFMTPHWHIESFQWLSNNGIGPAFYRPLFNGRLTVNIKSMNIRYKDSGVRFRLVSDIFLTGYSYILTVESTDGERLYYTTAGNVGKSTKIGFSVSPVGTEHSSIRLGGGVDLKPAKYKVKLLLFEAPFPGVYPTSETTVNIDGTSGEFVSKQVTIQMNDTKGDYEFETDTKCRVKSITYDEDKETKALKVLLSSKRYIRHFRRSNQPFDLFSKEGTLDRYDIKRAFSSLNIAKNSLKYVLFRKIQKTTEVTLFKSK